jgi:TatA/E family protein of Tat protein translocase
MGGSEILLILLAVLVLFGADKLPEFARNIGKGMREIKKATDEIKDELTRETEILKKDLNQIKDDNDLNNISKSINETASNIKNDGSYVDYYNLKNDIDNTVKK